MSLLAFSIAPFCHALYGSVKYTLTPIFSVISSCAANSEPLSVVIVFNLSLNGYSLSTVLENEIIFSAEDIENFLNKNRVYL